MIDIKAPEIEFALTAVRQAALLVGQIQARLVSPALSKADRSPVTVADFASQAVVGRLLSQAFPGDLLVAEEDSAALREPENALVLDQVAGFLTESFGSAKPNEIWDWLDYGRADSGERFWVLDPIDGTKGFLRGDQYAVALALVVKGQVQVGVLGCPKLAGASTPDQSGPGSLVIGVRGQGAWTTSLAEEGGFERLHVSEISTPAEARLLRSVESGHTNIDQSELFRQALGVKVPAVSMDSQAKYAVLAAGWGDLYLRLLSSDKPDYREKIWDQAAGSLIIAEAGGQVGDLQGKPLDFTTGRSLNNNRGILASNGRLHQFALQALAAISA